MSGLWYTFTCSEGGPAAKRQKRKKNNLQLERPFLRLVRSLHARKGREGVQIRPDKGYGFDSDPSGSIARDTGRLWDECSVSPPERVIVTFLFPIS